MQAVISGAHALLAGEAEVVVAGGMENMSAAPYLLRLLHSDLFEIFRLSAQRMVS